MDFAYLSTTAAEDWERWQGRNVEVRRGALGMATEPAVEYTNLRVGAVDIAVDRDGTVLLLVAGGIKRYDRKRDATESVWSNGDGARVDRPCALCVAGDRLYVADETGALVLVSRRSGEVVGRVDARLQHPVDIVRSDRRVYILDGGADGANGRVLTFRRDGLVETVVRGLADPTDIAADSSHLYIVERPDGTPAIRIHDVGHLESPSIVPTSRTIDELTRADEATTVAPLRVAALTDHELVLVGRETGTDETALYHYTFDRAEGTLTRRDDFPLTCQTLLTGPRDQSRRYPEYYAIAGEQNHVYTIDERQTNRRNPADDRYSARAFRRLDAGERDTTWNRLTLSLDEFPANTQVVTSYYASNHPVAGRVADLPGVPAAAVEPLAELGIGGVWDLLEADTDAVAAALDRPTADVEGWLSAAVDAVDGEAWHSAAANQRDILLESVTGRYLHVRVEFVGGVDASPEIGSFRAYCPKQTYLRYLPEQFGRAGAHDSFLERYLSVFESELVGIEEEIERITGYMDPEGVPNEYLSWLGSWLGIEFDERWPAAARREFLARAPTLFRLRGTKTGMRRTVRLYLNHVETPDTSWMGEWERRRTEARRSDGRLPDEAVGRRFREIDERTGDHPGGHLLFFLEHLDLDEADHGPAQTGYRMHMDGPRSFVVFVGPFVRGAHREAVERIVASERPAHTHGSVVELRQECKLAGSTFLGINSTLTSREFVLGRATLGGDAVLTERDQFA
jgi:phage tail-like protein